jgi:hypothetical protein
MNSARQRSSGVVLSAIARCQVQGWYMLVCCRACSLLIELSEDGRYTTTKRSVCRMVCQIFECSKYPVSFQMSVFLTSHGAESTKVTQLLISRAEYTIQNMSQDCYHTIFSACTH